MTVPPDKVPPQSLEMEQSTLGSMLIERAAIEKAAEILRPDDFYRDAHRVIFEAILSLVERGEPVDILSVQQQLRDQNVLENVGGAPYLIQLTNAVPTAANVEYYAKVVREKAILRHLLSAAREIQGLAHSDYNDISEVVDRAERAVLSVGQGVDTGEGLVWSSELTGRVFEEIKRRAESGKALSGVPTGLTELDRTTAGFQPAQFVVIAARPSMGKSALAAGIAYNVARKCGPVCLFSLEMTREEVMRRLLASEARVDGHRLARGQMSPRELERYREAGVRLASAPLAIDSTPNPSVSQLRSRIRRVVAEKGGVSLVVVDYLQMMGSGPTDNRHQELAHYARQFRQMAVEFDVPVVCCSQLNRSCEARQDKRPMLSDLRESGGIEEAADLVIAIYRDSYYQRNEAGVSVDPDAMDVAELLVLKHRNGPTGKVMVAFHPKYARFDNLAGEEA